MVVSPPDGGNCQVRTLPAIQLERPGYPRGSGLVETFFTVPFGAMSSVTFTRADIGASFVRVSSAGCQQLRFTLPVYRATVA